MRTSRITIRQRGFVLIVVLAAAAVIAAVVAGQLATAGKAQGTGIRAAEEVRARAIAEACLDMMTSYAEAVVPAPAPGDDFDVLLDPAGGMGSGDEYLPFAGNVVTIPPSAPAGSQLHKWNIVDFPAMGGACAVRFDDNSDDWRPDLPGGAAATTAAQEGPLVGDETERDRDLSVYATAIGMYPRLGAADAAVYMTAHTRVTLRRLIQLGNVFQPLAPAMWANTVDLNNNGDVCGAGGIMADDVSTDNNTCVCGQVNTDNPPAGTDPVQAGDTCSCPTSTCPAATVTSGAPPPDPPLNVHWGDAALLSNSALGPPMRAHPTDEPAPIGDGIGSGHGSTVPYPGSGYDIANGDQCVFYGKANAQLFLWDRNDPDAQATLNGLAGAAIAGIPGPEDCRSNTSDPLPSPCVWTEPAAGAWTLACGGGQSACWKLIAVLDSAELNEDVEVGAGPRREATGMAGDEEWNPQQGGGAYSLPNVSGSRAFGVDSANGAFICGLDQACTNCQNNGSDTGGDFLEYMGGTWDFDSDGTNENGPAPSVFFFEGNARLNQAGGGGGMGGPLRATVVSSANIDVDNSEVCCGTCDCSSLGAGLGPGGNCAPTNTLGAGVGSAVDPLVGDNAGLYEFTPPNSLAQDNRLAIGQGGFALKAGGLIDIDNASILIGDVRGNTVDAANVCFVGSVVGYSAAGDCGGGGTCGAPSVCFNNNVGVVGDVHSMADIDFNNNGVVFGNAIAKGSFCANNNLELEGTIQAGNTIQLNNNATIVNSASSAMGAPTQANAALQTYMETGW